MTAQTRATLKTYFENGDRPTQTQFEDLIDSPLILCASLGTPAHSTASLQAGSGLQVAQSGSVIIYGLLPIGARVYNASAFSISACTVTFPTFDSEMYDYGNCHSVATCQGVLVAPCTGIYLIWGGIDWSSNNVGRRSNGIRFNSDNNQIMGIQQFSSVQDAATTAVVSTVACMVAGEYAELRLYQDSTATLTANATCKNSLHFAMQMLTTV